MTYRNRIVIGDCRESMRAMIDAGVRVQCVVTSPPYWGLRDYGKPGQIGLERNIHRYVARLRGVMRLVWQLLADDGVCWLNLGDCYADSGRGGNPTEKSSGLKGGFDSQRASIVQRRSRRVSGLKPKDLVGVPWRVAFALQDDGWYLRSEVIWHKKNPMPESVTDRPTKAHEQIFLLTKSEVYRYDADAIREPSITDDPRRPYGSPGANALDARGRQGKGDLREPSNVKRGDFGGKTNELPGREAFRAFTETRNVRSVWRCEQDATFLDWFADQPGGAESLFRFERERKRASNDVWQMSTATFAGAHFATFPRELARRCIVAGSGAGDLVFDPFMGSGTVAEVAQENGRDYLGCELNPEFAAMFKALRSPQVGMPV
jgi:DNA modification methylase